LTSSAKERGGGLVAGLSGARESFWAATVAETSTDHAPLAGNLEVDVAIVGAGIVGLTSAQAPAARRQTRRGARGAQELTRWVS
jgi:hypothetical protein